MEELEHSVLCFHLFVDVVQIISPVNLLLNTCSACPTFIVHCKFLINDKNNFNFLIFPCFWYIVTVK